MEYVQGWTILAGTIPTKSVALTLLEKLELQTNKWQKF